MRVRGLSDDDDGRTDARGHTLPLDQKGPLAAGCTDFNTVARIKSVARLGYAR